MAAGRSAEDTELMLHGNSVYVTRIQKVGGAPVRPRILLLNLVMHDLWVLIATVDIIDRHRKATALRVPCGHSPQQVGSERRNTALARQVVT